MMIGGVLMFGSSINMIVSASSANLLELGLALIFGIGGAVVFTGGAVVLATVSNRTHARVVEDTTGPIPIIEQR